MGGGWRPRGREGLPDWVWDIWRELCISVVWSFEWTAGSDFFNVSASKNHQFQVFENKNQNQNELWIPIISKAFKSLWFSWKNQWRTHNFLVLVIWFFQFFLRNVIICQNQVLCSLRTMVLIPMNRPDNHQGSVPISNNCPIPLWTLFLNIISWSKYKLLSTFYNGSKISLPACMNTWINMSSIRKKQSG